MSDAERIARAQDMGWIDGRVIVLRGNGDATLPARLGPDAAFWEPHRPDHDRLTAAGATLLGDVTGTFDTAIVCATRSRAETLGLFVTAWEHVRDGGRVLITGQKTDGIDATVKRIPGIEDSLTKAHGRIALHPRSAERPSILDDWASGAAPSRNAEGFLTQAGLFSEDGIDPATALLAASFSPVLKGRAADFGAGWGALSSALLAASPKVASLDLIEADARALDCARANVTDPRATFHWGDVTTLSKGGYNLIVSNPPFHKGRSGEPSLGQAFIAAMARNLVPSGTALIVANRHLPYETTLEATFQNWEEVGGNGRFKLFRARRPKVGTQRR